MVCSTCGLNNEEGSKFCFGCGTKLEEKVDLATKPLAMASIVLKEDGSEIKLAFEPKLLIGRMDKDNGILPEIDFTEIDKKKVVSRKHAAILYNDGKFSIMDLGSVNGTFINGSKLNADTEYALQNGYEIMLGKLVFTFKYND